MQHARLQLYQTYLLNFSFQQAMSLVYCPIIQIEQSNMEGIKKQA